MKIRNRHNFMTSHIQVFKKHKIKMSLLKAKDFSLHKINNQTSLIFITKALEKTHDLNILI